MTRLLLALAAILLANPAVAATKKPLVLGSAGATQQIQTGDTIQTSASTTGGASINLPHGVAPTSPTNGDIWTTTSGVFARVNGTTGQLGALTGANTWTAKQTFSGGIRGDATYVTPATEVSGPNIVFDSTLFNGSGSAGFGLISNVPIPGSTDQTVAFINPGCAVCASLATTEGDIDLQVLYGATSTWQGLALRAGATAAFTPIADNTVSLGSGGYTFSRVLAHSATLFDATNPYLTLQGGANVTTNLIFNNNTTAAYEIQNSWTGSANAFSIYDFGASHLIMNAVSGSSITFTPGSSGSLVSARPAQLVGLTFVQLPTCNSGAAGTIAYITDASAAITAWHQAVSAGGGSNKAFIGCDGTNWMAL